jgi:hypothetical protein
MTLINFIEIETRSGYRSFELHEGDITNLGFHVDMIGFSAFPKDYYPSKGSVIGAFYENGVDVETLSSKPLIDLRDNFGVWVSEKMNENQLFNHLICLEFIDLNFSLEQLLENLFSVISILEVRKIKIETIALPILGTGDQMLALNKVIPVLLSSSLDFLKHAKYLEKIIFVVRNEEKAALLNVCMNDFLGREKIKTPNGPLVENIKQEIIREITKINSVQFENKVFIDLERIILSDFQAYELGGISRKVVEYILHDLIPVKEQKFELFKKIDSLKGYVNAAQWIISYLHVLRIFGNESVHDKKEKNISPKYIDVNDLTLYLFCMQRVLNFYSNNKKVKDK